jgi:ribosomal protein S18 acetylase RimI-like enzyme
MSEILHDLSAPASVAAIRANLFAWYRYLGRSRGAEFHDSPELTWLITGIPISFVNGVFRTRLQSQHVDAAVKATLAHVRSREVSVFSWWTEPGTQPADLGSRLERHGLRNLGGGPGMAADLLALNEERTAPPELTLERVRDRRALEHWARASIVGFGLPETFVPRWFELFSDLGFELPLRSYVGMLEGEPVATSQLFLGAGVAGIYVVATLPEARRQGIGAALTLAALLDARAMGCRTGILHSSSMGEGVYRRLGFQEYCRVSYHVWLADPDGWPG